MYTYKIYIFFIDAYNIIIKYDKLNYIYIYIYQIIQQNNFKMFIILLITFLWDFSYISMSFDEF